MKSFRLPQKDSNLGIDADPSSRFRNQQLRYELLKQLIHVQQESPRIPHTQLFTQRATLKKESAKLMNLAVILVEPVVAKPANDRPWHGCWSYFAESRIQLRQFDAQLRLEAPAT